jgi:hypothetical protein
LVEALYKNVLSDVVKSRRQVTASERELCARRYVVLCVLISLVVVK